MTDTPQLQARWTHLYRDYLPALAKARDPVQKSWPVVLDHCFARIILDNAIGVDRTWTEVLKQPAVKNMSKDQLQASIGLAEKVAKGEAGLVELNERSLSFRGKKRKAASTENEAENRPSVKKGKRSTSTISSYFLPSPTSPSNANDSRDNDHEVARGLSDNINLDPQDQKSDPDMSVQFKRISKSNITPFRKQMLTLLSQIPRGRYSTYQAMSDYVSKTSHKTCARAVGNAKETRCSSKQGFGFGFLAMRNNPFAPEVPCHRVLANDGTLGGFNGYWGEGGKFANKKHELLHEEGVRFDSRGKVKGPPFREFWE